MPSPEIDAVGGYSTLVCSQSWWIFFYAVPVADAIRRFKYTKVKSNDFGLSAEEILLADDKVTLCTETIDMSISAVVFESSIDRFKWKWHDC